MWLEPDEADGVGRRGRVQAAALEVLLGALHGGEELLHGRPGARSELAKKVAVQGIILEPNLGLHLGISY